METINYADLVDAVLAAEKAETIRQHQREQAENLQLKTELEAELHSVVQLLTQTHERHPRAAIFPKVTVHSSKQINWPHFYVEQNTTCFIRKKNQTDTPEWVRAEAPVWELVTQNYARGTKILSSWTNVNDAIPEIIQQITVCVKRGK